MSQPDPADRLAHVQKVYGRLHANGHTPRLAAFRRAALDTGTPPDVFDAWAASVTWERA